MKAVYCIRCNSLVRLVKKERNCECGHAGGHYLEDGINAEFYGEDAVPIGIGSYSFRQAIKHRPHDGMGERFTAWVMPTIVKTFKYMCR